MKRSISAAIATDNVKLNRLISELFGEKAEIGDETPGDGGYNILDPTVCGVLVMTRSEDGAVRAVGLGDDENMETGPRRKAEYWIIYVEKGQSGAILGKPSYRLISRAGA